MKYAITLLTLFFGLTLWAQEDAPSDTTKTETTVKFGDIDVIVKKDGDKTEVDFEEEEDDGEPDKEELTWWGGIDLGVNTLVTSSGSTSLPDDAQWLDTEPIRSMSWNINLFESKIRLVKDHVGILTGLGLTYNSYGLKNNIAVMSNSDSTFAVTVPDSLYTLDKNKLRATYVRVPLMLEFNTSLDPDRSLHLAAGVIGGVRIGSITKQEFQIDDQKHKNRVKDDFNISPFTLDASVRVGYSNFTIFANYGLTPLFESGKGPEVYPVTVGISLVPF